MMGLSDQIIADELLPEPPRAKPGFQPWVNGLPEDLFRLRPDGSLQSYDQRLEPLVQAIRAEVPAPEPPPPAPPPQLSETRINAMLQALQTQRDEALNKLVHLGAEYALAADELRQAREQIAAMDPGHANG
jgi:hypothetical protein